MKRAGLMLPHKCQTVGWTIIAIPFILLGILLLSQLLCAESQFTHLIERYCWILISSLYLCIPIGGAILCFSKEKEEDEMIRSIRLKTIGIMAIAELLICVVLFCYWGLNTTFGFYNPATGSTDYIFFRYLGHFIFCLQFPVYFLLFKFILYINRKRNEE